MPPAWRQPQPYEELDHTADVGVRVRGDDPAEALARLVLALADVLTGGQSPTAAGAADGAGARQLIEIAGDPDRAVVAVDALRAVLEAFQERGLVPVEVAVPLWSDEAARLVVAFGRLEPERRAGAPEIKAVTWHAARFERDGDGWLAQAVFDR